MPAVGFESGGSPNVSARLACPGTRALQPPTCSPPLPLPSRHGSSPTPQKPRPAVAELPGGNAGRGFRFRHCQCLPTLLGAGPQSRLPRTAGNPCGHWGGGGGQATVPPPPGPLKSGKPLRKEIDSSKKLPLEEDLSRSARRAKYLQRGSWGRTKPLSLSELLRSQQSGPCVETELPLAASSAVPQLSRTRGSGPRPWRRAAPRPAARPRAGRT